MRRKVKNKNRSFRIVAVIAVLLMWSVFLCACGTERSSTSQASSINSEEELNAISDPASSGIGEGTESPNQKQASKVGENTAQGNTGEDRKDPGDPGIVDSVKALDVEGDSVEFEPLIQLAGASEDAVRNYLGISPQDTKATLILFGEMVDLYLQSVEDSGCSFYLQFKTIDLNQLENAISEQLGEDGRERDGIYVWDYEGKSIQLYEEDWGCMVDVAAN